MEERKRHTGAGKASLALGILGIISFAFLSILLGLIMGIFAVILGHRVKKEGDNFGNYGMIIGAVTIISSIIIFLWVIFK